MAIIAAPVAIGAFNGSLQPSPNQPSSAQQSVDFAKVLANCQDVFTSAQSAGLIVSYQSDQTDAGAYPLFTMVVDPGLWDQLPFTAKTGIAAAGACIADGGDWTKQGTGDIKDNMNNKELGEYNGVEGRFTAD